MSTYVLTLLLNTEKFQEDIINRRLEIGRNIYNSILNNALKRYNLMLESREYRKLKSQLKISNKEYHNCNVKKLKNSLNKNRKELYKKLQNIYLKYGLTQYSLYGDVKLMYKHFKDNIDSLVSQAIADRVWSAFDKLLNGNGKKVYFKKYGEFNSIENKWNKSGLKYDNKKGNIIWKGLIMPIIIKANDSYAQKAIQDRVKYCRIVRKLIRGKYKYYVQMIMEGAPPIKVNKNTGEIKRYLGNGNVGIDIGTSTIAYCSDTEVKLLELAPEIENIEKQKRKLQRKMDRQRRVNNPENYNKDGTIKRGKKLKWVKSKKYIRTQNELKELQRKQSDIRKQSHEKLANHIIGLGDRILVETMNYSGLQARAKKTTKNKNGKFNKKKRFGKSLANKAPAMLIEIINRKLKYDELKILKINTYTVKASQYNHFEDKFIKKDLSERWNDFNVNEEKFRVQRDLYSSFLIMNVNNDLETINRDLCFEKFDGFKLLHNKEIKRLESLKESNFKLVSSFGI